jgi:ribosomal protein S9
MPSNSGIHCHGPTQDFGRADPHVARQGKIDINGRSFEDYFPTAPLQNVVLQPLQTAKLVNAYDLWINASGGGATGRLARCGSRFRGRLFR